MILLRRFLAIFALLALPLFGGERVLTEMLKQARVGDYIVTEQNKTYTVLSIARKEGDRVVFEELSGPKSTIRRKMRKMNGWREWIAKDAPGHSSWVKYEIDLETASLSEYFSFTKNGWLDLGTEDNFLTTLLEMEMERVPDAERRRMGRPSKKGVDTRPIWTPDMVVDGEKLRGVSFAAYSGVWPKDSSKLSGRTITIYIPEDSETYAAYFPYWVDIDSRVPGTQVRVVDSGRALETATSALPRMPPSILERRQDRTGDLVIKVRSRQAYQKLRVYALDEQAGQYDPVRVPLSYRQISDSRDPEVLHLRIPERILDSNLDHNHSYRFLVAVADYPGLSTETEEIWRWRED